MNEFIKNPDFCAQDIFKKHPEYSFSMNDSMSGTRIKEIRNEVMKKMNVKISYTHPLFQMLKRGIGLYTSDMPEEYLWILQRLMNNRELGIIISDRTLCLGINLPILSCCIYGYDNEKFTRDDYLQMTGRAGRRGLDTMVI